MRMATGAQVITSLTRPELMDSLKPFFDRLGINKYDVYRDQPIVIGRDSVTFVMAAGQTSSESGRRDSVRAPWHPQGSHDPNTGDSRRGEYAHFVSVRVYDHGAEPDWLPEKYPPIKSGRVFIRRHRLWLAWYPKRGLRCTFRPERTETGWHLAVAVGPAYVGVGPGRPTP